jgi:hypothetical protein
MSDTENFQRVAKSDTFSDWLRAHPCPQSGSGVHRWILSASLAALRRSVALGECETAIIAAMSRPPNSRREVRDALRKAGASGFTGEAIHRPRWPKPLTLTTAEHYAALGRQSGVIGLVEVSERSPVRLLDDVPLTKAIIERLVGPNELLCCARGVEHAETRHATEFSGRLQEFTHLVPLPMSALSGDDRADVSRTLARAGFSSSSSIASRTLTGRHNCTSDWRRTRPWP